MGQTVLSLVTKRTPSAYYRPPNVCTPAGKPSAEVCEADLPGRPRFRFHVEVEDRVCFQSIHEKYEARGRIKTDKLLLADHSLNDVEGLPC